MEFDIRKLEERMEAFGRAHKLAEVPGRKAFLDAAFERLELELKGEAVLNREENGRILRITVTGSSFFSCQDGCETLKFLIGAADIFEAGAADGNVVIRLSFALEEWEEV